MTEIITYLDHNGKYAYYAGSDINDLYFYLYIIGDPTNWTYSGQNFHLFDLKTNTYSGFLNPVISALQVKKRIVCGFYGQP